MQNNKAMILGLFLAMMAAMSLTNCDKEMLLTDFTDYEFDYQPELRIEAFLNTEFPERTVVRIDYSMSVTDTSIFNGRDDDGDWMPFEDENKNSRWDAGEPLNDDLGEDGMPGEIDGFIQPDEGEGDGLPTVGEPHIDELDEIIPQLHDSTFTVSLHKFSTGAKVADFGWQTRADSSVLTYYYETEEKEVFWFGGYKLTNLTEPIDYQEKYEFKVNKGSDEYRASFQPERPVEFLTDFFTMNNDTLIVTEADSLAPIWSTGSDPIVFWVVVERIFRPDSIVIVTDSPAMPLIQQNGLYIGGDFINFYFPGLYRWTVYVPSQNYGRYVYSSLPITDSSISNWRSQNGDVIMGCAGSMAAKSIYVRIDKEVEKLK